jgi:hypothetical protein
MGLWDQFLNVYSDLNLNINVINKQKQEFFIRKSYKQLENPVEENFMYLFGILDNTF